MKKFMTMAMIATMTMVMGNNVMAAETTPAPETFETEMTRFDNASETRVMIRKNGREHYKFEYTIDNEGRVSTKTMFRYDDVSDTWKPVMLYRATYGTNSNTLSFAAWSNKDNSFSSHAMKTTYEKSECPVLIYLPECLNY